MKPGKLTAIILALGIGFLPKYYANGQSSTHQDSKKAVSAQKSDCGFTLGGSVDFKSRYIPKPGVETGRGPVLQKSVGVGKKGIFSNNCLDKLTVNLWDNYSISDKKVHEFDFSSKYKLNIGDFTFSAGYGRFWFPTNLVPDIHETNAGIGVKLPFDLQLNVAGYRGFFADGGKYADATVDLSRPLKLEDYFDNWLRNISIDVGIKAHIAIQNMGENEPKVDHVRPRLYFNFPIGKGFSATIGFEYIKSLDKAVESGLNPGISIQYNFK